MCFIAGTECLSSRRRFSPFCDRVDARGRAYRSVAFLRGRVISFIGHVVPFIADTECLFSRRRFSPFCGVLNAGYCICPSVVCWTCAARGHRVPFVADTECLSSRRLLFSIPWYPGRERSCLPFCGFFTRMGNIFYRARSAFHRAGDFFGLRYAQCRFCGFLK